jgi:hypothetical protein
MYAFGRETAKTTEKALSRGNNGKVSVMPPQTVSKALKL